MALRYNKNQNNFANIKIIGIGGAGNNAIDTMIKRKLKGLEFVAVNTDLQALNSCLAENKMQIGKNIVHGHGVGGVPELGRKCAEDNISEIEKELKDTEVVFFAAGMGGGTGTGAVPVFAKIAKENKILSIAIVNYPFDFEGKIKQAIADKGIEEIKKYVNSLIVISNNKVREFYGKLKAEDTFTQCDLVLYNAAKTISDIIIKKGHLNVDIGDVKTVLSQMGYAMIGFGKGEGEKRKDDALKNALQNPLIEGISLENSKAVLANISIGYDIKFDEYYDVMEILHKKTPENTNIISGLFFDKNMKNKMEIAIIATGIPEKEEQEEKLMPKIQEKSKEEEQSEIQMVLNRIHESEKAMPDTNEDIDIDNYNDY